MKRINLIIIGVCSFGVSMLLILYIKAESKPLENAFSKEWSPPRSSSLMPANLKKGILQSTGSDQISRQIRRKSCCSGTSRYCQLKQVPDSLKSK